MHVLDNSENTFFEQAAPALRPGHPGPAGHPLPRHTFITFTDSDMEILRRVFGEDNAAIALEILMRAPEEKKILACQAIMNIEKEIS